MTFGELIRGLEEGIGNISPLFPFFKKELINEINSIPRNPLDWQDREDLFNIHNLASFFGLAVNSLFHLAMHFADSTDDPVYEEATNIAETIRTLLEETFGIKIEPVEIKSPTRTMEQTGLLKIVVSGSGEQFVQPTQLLSHCLSRSRRFHPPSRN